MTDLKVLIQDKFSYRHENVVVSKTQLEHGAMHILNTNFSISHFN